VNNLGTINGPGSITAGGTISVNNGGSITSVGDVTITPFGSSIIVTGNATFATTGNVTAPAVLAIGRSDIAVASSVPGTLTMSPGSRLLVGTGLVADVRIGENLSGTSGGSLKGILDASAAANVTITATTFRLGVGNAGAPSVETYGYVQLPTASGATSTLVATTSLLVGVANSAIGGTQTAANVFGTGTFGSVFDLGNQTVSLRTPLVTIGATRSSGTALFNGTGGNFTLNNGAGNTAVNIGVSANTTNQTTASNVVGLFDGRGGNITANISTLIIGNNSDAGGLSTTQGIFILSGANSNVTATSVSLGGKVATAGATSGNLTVLGGLMSVTGNVTTGPAGGNVAVPNLFSVAGGNVSVGNSINLGNGVSNLSVSGGVLNFGNNLLANSTGNTTFNLSGGIVNANNRNFAALTAFNFTGGFLNNAGSVAQAGGITNAGGSLVRNQAGNTTINGIYSQSSGDTSITAGNLSVTGNFTQTGGTATIGGSGLATITGNLSIGGTFTTNSTTTVSGGLTSITSTGTLMGTGVLASLNANVAAGGIVAPGASIGTLTVNGNVSLAMNSLFNVEIGNGNTADRLNVATSGFLNFATGANVTALPSNITFVENNSYQFTVANVGAGLGGANLRLDGAGSLANATLATATIGGSPTGPLNLDISGLGLDNGDFATLAIVGDNVVLTVTAIPEPMSITLIGAASLGAFGWVRRRRNKAATTIAS